MAYVDWQRQVRDAEIRGLTPPTMPDHIPVSINLDPTTGCNYDCTHCIDFRALNTGIKHEDAKLKASLTNMAKRGLRSVILIGGGEPTLPRSFEDTVCHIKDPGLQVAIVSNGSRNERILNIVGRLEKRDWVRLSLDSGSNELFRAMHKPKNKTLTLDEICSWVPKIRERNPLPQVGFSYIIVWEGAEREEGVEIIPNIHEIVMATKRARDSQFSYISLKPFLKRSPTGAEVMDEAAMADFDRTIAEIRAAVDEAKLYETDEFQVIESRNLKMLEEGTWRELTHQPQMCHKQFFQQVVSPLGVYNCPAHRGIKIARIADNDGYADDASILTTQDATRVMLNNFDASVRCAGVTCIYNSFNRAVERAIRGELAPEDLEMLEEHGDYFF